MIKSYQTINLVEEMIRKKDVKDLLLVGFFLLLVSSISLEQGELTINGSITSTHLDFTIEYTDDV